MSKGHEKVAGRFEKFVSLSAAIVLMGTSSFSALGAQLKDIDASIKSNSLLVGTHVYQLDDQNNGYNRANVINALKEGNGATYFKSFNNKWYNLNDSNIKSLDDITGNSTTGIISDTDYKKLSVDKINEADVGNIDTTKTTAAGTISLSSASGTANSNGEDMLVTYSLGEAYTNGSVVFEVPSGFAVDNTATVQIGTKDADAISDVNSNAVVSGNKVTISNITAASGTNVILHLEQQTLPSQGTYTFSAVGDVDGAGSVKEASLASRTDFTSTQSDWTQTFSDEFNGTNGTAPDSAKWSYDLGNGSGGWGNNELENYTNSTDNVSMQSGNLVIKAMNNATTDPNGVACNYTSGKIKTLGKFSQKYGRVDIRAKLPLGKGMWPAMWMLPANDKYGGWAASGEVDITEGWGDRNNQVAGTLHYGASWPNNKYTGKTYTFPQGQTVDQFHTYSLEWEPGEIRWYIDGKLYQTQNNWYTKGVNNEEKYSFPAPFDQPFYLVLNLAVGGNFDGNPDSTSGAFPKEMDVDYLRVYSLTGRPYKTVMEPSIPKENLPSGARSADNTGNLITDTNFSSGIKDNPEGANDFGDGWNFVHIGSAAGAGNVATETVNGGTYAKVNVTQGGNQNYSVQLIQLTTLGKGRYYKLSFDAKSSVDRTIGVKMGGGDKAGWPTYSDSYTVNLTNSLQHFEKTFQMTRDSDIAARLEFELGLNTNPVWIGNVRLEEYTPVEDLNAPKAPLAVSGNYVYNGAFDKGTIDRMEYWNFNKNASAGAIATASVPEDTREMTVAIANGGTFADDVTLDQRGILLIGNSNYQLTFKAKADAARTIGVKFVGNDGTVYYSQPAINIGTTMDTKTVSFTMPSVTDNSGKLMFEFGGSTVSSNVYLDDVLLRKTTTDYSNVNLYPLKNGDFATGDFTGWTHLAQDVGGAANFTVASNVVNASITNIGPNPYSVMLFSDNMSMKKDITYVVSFDASSTANRNMLVTLENSSYDRFLDKTIALSGTKQNYSFEFKMPSDQLAALKFQMGKVDGSTPTATHIVSIGNVVCQVKDANFIASIVKNGRFDNGTKLPWQLYTGDGANASLSVTKDNYMEIAETASGANSWSVQAYQEGLKFENGKHYIVGFKAKADAARKINVNIGRSWPDYSYTPYVDTKTFDVNNQLNNYTFDFTMNKETYDNGKIVFEAGNVTGGNTPTNLYITDVYVIQKDAATSQGGSGSQTGSSGEITGGVLTTNNINKIQNGTFDADTSNWQIWKGDGGTGVADAIYGSVNGVLKIQETTIGSASYSPQVYQEGFTLENGKTYVVKFKAKADAARKMNVNIGKALTKAPWFTNYADTQIVDLGTGMKEYEYTFTVTQPTDPNLKMVFEVGNVTGGNTVTNIYIDDVSISQLTTASAAD